MGKFDNFEIITTDYKIVGSHGIAVDLLIPPTLPKGPRPIIVRFHGGGFVSGSSLFEPWFPQWLLELAVANNAVIVSPNHRFLPESSGLDIMADLDDLWNWLHSGLPDTLEKSVSIGLRADLDRIMTEGDSAGGYLSIQLAMNHPAKIRACIAEFPCLDFKSPHFSGIGSGMPAGTFSLVDQHLATVGKNIASSDMNLSRFPLINAMIQEGRLLDFFGDDPRLFPLQRVEAGDDIPPLFIIHGLNDSIVPVDGSTKFVKLLLEKKPGAEVHLTVQPGEHGVSIPFGVDHPWLAEGLKLVTEKWLN